MDIETFVRAEVAAHGKKVVFHNGIWWERLKPFYSWPLNFLKAYPRGTVRPPFSSRIIGYGHVVPTEAEANTTLGMSMLRDVGLYDLDNLSAKMRSHIRRGLKRVEVRKLEDVRDLLEQGVEINQSALSRRPWDDSSGSRWMVDDKLWRQEIGGTHECGARKHWGAYSGGRLIGWMQVWDVEGIINIEHAMSHSDYLSDYPNYALYHTFLLDCRKRPGVTSVFCGTLLGNSGLYEFKRRLGFEPAQLPVYRWLNPLVRSVLDLRTRKREAVPEEGLAESR